MHGTGIRRARGALGGLSRMDAVQPSSSGRAAPGLADLRQEAVEEMDAVVRSGSRPRAVLDAAAGGAEQRQSLDSPVVEVDVRELRGAEVGVPAHRLVAVDRLLPAGAEHREAVVLRGDLDASGLEVLDGVVGAAVPERQLERLQPERAAE